MTAHFSIADIVETINREVNELFNTLELFFVLFNSYISHGHLIKVYKNSFKLNEIIYFRQKVCLCIVHDLPKQDNQSYYMGYFFIF